VQLGVARWTRACRAEGIDSSNRRGPDALLTARIVLCVTPVERVEVRLIVRAGSRSGGIVLHDSRRTDRTALPEEERSPSPWLIPRESGFTRKGNPLGSREPLAAFRARKRRFASRRGGYQRGDTLQRRGARVYIIYSELLSRALRRVSHLRPARDSVDFAVSMDLARRYRTRDHSLRTNQVPLFWNQQLDRIYYVNQTRRDGATITNRYSSHDHAELIRASLVTFF
jgi:hypothetical protein